MINNIIAKCTTVALIYPLASNPKLGINGVILAISMGVILGTILQYFSVMKLIGFALDIRNIIMILVAGITMGYIGRMLLTPLNNLTSKLGIAMLLGISLSVVVYVGLLVLLRVIPQNNIERIPLIGRMLALLFPK